MTPRDDTSGAGDRTALGGARDEVVCLGFLTTTITEMGQPPSAAGDDRPCG